MSRVTSAERRALEAVWKHGTAKQAAAALGKSQRTVEQQLRSARAKLDVTTTIEAVRASRAYVDKADIRGETA
jgi:DNA-binding CsgD family transcriptional regulator